MSGKCMIDTPQKFADHADKTITGITSLYLPEEEVLVGPEDIEKAHIVKGPSTFRKFRTWIFFNSGADKKLFFTQY